MLHLFDGTHDVGIFEPALLLKRYHLVTTALSHLYDEPTVACVILRSTAWSRVYELHSGPVRKKLGLALSPI